MTKAAKKPVHKRIAIVMGSKSDWETMSEAAKVLDQLNVTYHVEVVSAHRTPKKLVDFATTAIRKGYDIIIAGAGGAAHLPGMIAAMTRLPVLGVPVQSKSLNGLDSLLSIAQMPKGVAVGTLAIGTAGAYNAGLLAAQILSLHNATLAKAIERLRIEQTRAVLDQPDPRKPSVHKTRSKK